MCVEKPRPTEDEMAEWEDMLMGHIAAYREHKKQKFVEESIQGWILTKPWMTEEAFPTDEEMKLAVELVLFCMDKWEKKDDGNN